MPEDKNSKARLLNQFYTCPTVASYLYSVCETRYRVADYLLVEPSAGTGSFFSLMPRGSLGYDIDPKFPGIQTADFFDVELPSKNIMIIGNPPFGKNASTAVKFFNRAAQYARIIAFTVPRSFKKASVENRLDRYFELVAELPVPRNAFTFEGKPYNVPAVFQIWERRTAKRALRLVETTHPDFEFTTSDLADFAITRVGDRAGRVHHDFSRSTSSTYFIRGDVETIMVQLDFASVVGNVAGNPSLAKSEIIALYRAKVGRPARHTKKKK